MPNFSVLMAVAKYPATHGHNTVINNLCLGLKKLGVKTAIGALSFTSDPPNGVEKIILDKRKLLRNGINYFEFDIIHSHQPRINYYLLFNKPTKPVIFHYHGPSTLIHKINFKLSMKLFGKRISKIITVSNTALEQMNALIGHFPSEVVYNGVDTEIFNPNLITSYKKGSPQLLFVSALRPYKNADILINSMPLLLKKYPNAHLQIIGNGEIFNKLKELIQKKKLHDNVDLVGEIKDPSELALRYSSCDLYVSASSLEACPAPPFEAMSCGKPLVLSNIDAHKEIISLSKSGIIFSSNDAATLCEKITEAYQQKEILGKNARRFAEEHDWSSTCKQIIQIYENLTNKKIT
jgi:glycosyltransferase involved in cell wall biosynthesis